MKNIYSDWLKLDLHIHSDWSKKTKDNDYQGDFNINLLKQKLIDNEVSIFSITDHNIINIEAYTEYYSKYDQATDPLLLLGIELDVVVVRNKERIYHTLLIFNCDNIEKVSEINNKLENLYKQKGIQDPKQRKITINEIAQLFKGSDFFFIPHAYSDKSIVTAHKDGAIEDAQKMVLLMSCGLEKVTTEETIENYNNGFNKLLTSNFQSKNDIPYINFSDNHNINKYPCKHKGTIGTHDFYYIKGSKSFESIRLAFIDPESRIKTTTQISQINKTNNTIDCLKISNSGFINNTELFFSPHLNVIIGGRSSGKSLLMWLIGNKINAEVKNNAYEKYDQGNVLIKSKNDAEYKFHTAQPSHIYIKQGDIIDYFEKGRLSELAKKSNKLEEYSQHKQIIKNKKNDIESDINNLINSYTDIFNLGLKQQHILHNKSIDHILSPHYIIKFEKDRLIKQTDISLQLEEINDTLNLLIGNTEKLLTYKDLLAIDESEDILINQIKELLEQKLSLVNHKKTVNTQKAKFITCINQHIDQQNSTLSEDAKNKELSIKELAELKKNIADRFCKVQKLKNACNKIESLSSEINSKFNIDDNIKLILDASIKDSIAELLIDGIKNAKVELSLFHNLLCLLLQKDSIAIKNHTVNSPENLSKKFKNQLDSTFKAFDSPKDYLEYEDGETSKDKSPGYNSEKYLNIILNNPAVNIIIIDQPEDNLGNKFIADELVKLIRSIKYKKQIFLVTHNPSVVVYGDAESIILAKNEDNIITYKQIVLEDSNAQKEICGILDGGEYIFNNRYKKYNIQRINRN